MEKAIPIESKEGSHFGFLLISNNESDSGECVFMLTPKDAESFEDPNFQYLERFGVKVAGEHRWIKNEDLVSISLSTDDKAVMDLAATTLVINEEETYRIKTRKVEQNGGEE